MINFKEKWIAKRIHVYAMRSFNYAECVDAAQFDWDWQHGEARKRLDKCFPECAPLAILAGINFGGIND